MCVHNVYMCVRERGRETSVCVCTVQEYVCECVSMCVYMCCTCVDVTNRVVQCMHIGRQSSICYTLSVSKVYTCTMHMYIHVQCTCIYMYSVHVHVYTCIYMYQIKKVLSAIYIYMYMYMYIYSTTKNFMVEVQYTCTYMYICTYNAGCELYL